MEERLKNPGRITDELRCLPIRERLGVEIEVDSRRAGQAVLTRLCGFGSDRLAGEKECHGVSLPDRASMHSRAGLRTYALWESLPALRDPRCPPGLQRTDLRDGVLPRRSLRAYPRQLGTARVLSRRRGGGGGRASGRKSRRTSTPRLQPALRCQCTPDGERSSPGADVDQPRLPGRRLAARIGRARSCARRSA